jgi:hypothetical protein
MEIKLSQIESEYQACPYCMEVYDGNYRGCCGEAHSELAYVVDGVGYLESECTIIDDSMEMLKEREENYKLDKELGK